VREGWYLMNVSELESALAAWRARDHAAEFGIPLSVGEAIDRRNEGNHPDADDRSLRLVLFVDAEPLERKRLRWEPDFHEAPTWRTENSRPVNVVPLRAQTAERSGPGPWWEEDRVEELETEWRRTGSVAGIEVPADYRSFVFKTVIALRDSGRDVTPETIGDSIARWLSPEDARKIKDSLKQKGPGL
jgi:hypothetical protein